MVRRTWPAILMALAMLAGIAHAGLHLAAAPDGHYDDVAKIGCPLATVDKWGGATVLPSLPHRIAAPPVAVTPKHIPLSRRIPSWRPRAPPVAA